MIHITRRRLLVGAAAAGASAALGFKAWQAAKKPRPNLILLIADDMRFDAAACLGSAEAVTPNIDALAQEGALLRNMFVTTSICPISRASIMTGQYARRHGIWEFMTPIGENTQRIAFHRQLKDAGYYTGFIGKWGYGDNLPKKEFDYWKGYGGQGDYFPGEGGEHITDIQTQDAVRFLRRRPKDKPFLLILCYKAPHNPLKPQGRFNALYRETIFMRDPTDTAQAASLLPAILANSSGRKKYEEILGTEALFQERRRKYYQLIAGIDESIQRIMQALKHSGLDDNTMAVLTSDNGEMEGAHGLNGKWCMYEASIRVPMIIRPAKHFMPQFTYGVRDACALNIDIAPTLLDAAGITPPAQMQGQSLMPVLRGEIASRRDGFFYEHPEMGRFDIPGCEGWRDSEWKYSRYFRQDKSEEVLFHLPDDPQELRNLALLPESGPILAQMRQRVEESKRQLV